MVKIVAVFHAILAGVILVIASLLNPTGFFCTGIPPASFQLFVLSWWLWRFPTLENFRERVLLLGSGKAPLTPAQEEGSLHRAWQFRLGFVIAWGWFVAVLYGYMATWLALLGGCPPMSIFLLGVLFTSVVGWLVGGAWVTQKIYRTRDHAD